MLVSHSHNVVPVTVTLVISIDISTAIFFSSIAMSVIPTYRSTHIVFILQESMYYMSAVYQPIRA